MSQRPVSKHGIEKYFEADAARRKEAEKAERERLIEVDRKAKELGITLVTQPESTNREAYEWVERRTRELQAKGHSLLEATQIARNEQEPEPQKRETESDS